MGSDHIPTENGCPMHRAIAAAVIEGLPSEYGVRFPSGAVQELPEDEARRASLAYNRLRPDLPTFVVRKSVSDWEVPEPEQCGAPHPSNDSVVPCVLDEGHPVEEDHFSTTGCAGSEVSWSQFVHPADLPPAHMPPDHRPVCRYEYAGHDGPCEKPPVCGKPYRDRNGDPDTCSFPENHDGSCW